MATDVLESQCVRAEAAKTEVPFTNGLLNVQPSLLKREVFAQKDLQIIQALAASEHRHARLRAIAKQVQEVLCEGAALHESAVLYGSLSLDPGDAVQHLSAAEHGSSDPDWAKHYVHMRSDIDYAVELRAGVPAPAVVHRLMRKGRWRVVQETRVAKFSTMQYTLAGHFKDNDEAEEEQESSAAEDSQHSSDGSESDQQAREVYLDLTCIDKPLDFERFKRRQEAFRLVFFEVRNQVDVAFEGLGARAFDAYIHLLKAFARKVPGNALTGFQATCIGLFTLQLKQFRLRPSGSIALAFFEGFLRFCTTFFAEPHPGLLLLGAPNYRHCAIDLSHGWFIPRQEWCWRSEMYFQALEGMMETHPHERANIARSIDPATVCFEARELLTKAFVSRAPFGFGAGMPWA